MNSFFRLIEISSHDNCYAIVSISLRLYTVGIFDYTAGLPHATYQVVVPRFLDVNHWICRGERKPTCSDPIQRSNPMTFAPAYVAA